MSIQLMKLFNNMNSEKTNKDDMRHYLGGALARCECLEDYEEVIELWKTYGGD